MIPQITEINFPSYATLNSATITLSEMGDRNITTQIKIDGDIVPDFSGWELEFKGERFILPVKEPQAAKDNTSRRSIVDLTFSSWAVQEMKRYFFVEMTSIESGTAIADKYKASLGLNIENFVTAFNNVLNYYFNGKIEMDLFGSGTGIYSSEPAFFEIDYTHIWDVLQKIYEIYEVRWTITYDSSTEKYVIKVGYPAAEIDDHDFEYGYQGGLLRFERQVQDYDITNVLLGRGGEKNLPYRYFKKVDPRNPNWAGDPDAIPELKNIYFENLRDINFRRYVQGWKTNPNRILEEGDVVETYDSARGETDFAYAKGHTDERFNPVEYVKDDASIAIYGERWGALDNADDIYPTIQGIEVDPYGRIDQVVDVEDVTTDDIEAMAADAAEVMNLKGSLKTEWINSNSTLVLDINGADFTVPEGKIGNLATVGTWVDTLSYGKKQSPIPFQSDIQSTISAEDPVRNLVTIDTVQSYIVAVNKSTSIEVPASAIPAGSYYYKLHIVVKSEFESSMYKSVEVTVGVDGLKLTTSEGNANAWKPTFDIWVKNIWNTTQESGESDEQYAARVWEPILGDRTGEEAKIAFSTGFLSLSEDYNFTIASIPVVDRTKTIDGVASEWRITLIKSDAEYEATGKYIPNAETGGNASAGDYFFFTGIDMPWAYVLWAEEKLNAYKTAELAKLKQINPTWIIRIDKVRANTKEQGELEYLADRFASGAKLRVKDKRFTNGQVLTLYVQTVTYTWQEPSNGNPYLVPDIEVVLSDKVETVASPIDQLEGSVDLIQSTYAKISDIESAIRRVASPIFLKKTGESERSLSPTRFSSLMASESFRQGDIGGQGWGAYTDGEGHSVLEADTIVVRKDMRVNTLTVNQIAYLGGKQIISAAAMECNRVEVVDGGYKCYFDQKQGSVANLFKVDDIVLGQVWNADESELRYYKRKVIAIDSDSITLSSTIADGTGIPQPKDVLVQYGSYSDTSRQYVIVRDVIGGGYERMLSGLTTVFSNGEEYYFAGRQDGSTPRWFVGDANGQHASYQDGVLNITGRLSVTTQVDKGNGTYESLSNYLSNLQDQIDGNIQTWYATGEPTLQNYPANTWPTVEDKNNHIGDLYYESETGKAYRFMLDGNTYKWVQIADEDIAAALALAQQNQTAIAGLAYLKAATNQGTLVQGGLVLTSMIQLGQTEEGAYKVYSGINGIMDTSALGNGIAAWYGGPMADIGADSTLTDFAKSLFRFDGSGYLASGNIKWDLNGNGEIPGISWNNGRITLSPDIYLQGGDRLTQIVDAVNRMYTQFAYDSHDNITVAPTHALYIPTTSPAYPIEGKVALYYDYNGNYSELPSGGVGEVFELTLRNGATVLGIFQPGVEDKTIDLSPMLSGYATQSWVSANFNKYVLPTASASVLGGIKIGTGLTIDATGVVSVTGQTQGTVTRVDLGTTQYSPNDSGVVTLPSYPTTLPASDVSAWAKKTSLAASDVPTLAISKISGLQDALDGKQPLDADLTAIAALTGSGLLRRSSNNTWSLDANTYLTSSDHKALTLKVGSITVASNYNALTARTYTITKANLTDTIGSTTYAPYHADGYLPLSAGSTKPLTGDLYFDSSSANKHIYFKYANNGLGSALRMSRGGSLILGENQRTNGNSTSIYGSELIVDFGTDAAPYAVLFSGGIVRPFNSTVSLGSSTSRWDEVYASKVYSDVVKVSDILAIPTSAPSSTASGEVYLWASSLGDYAETPSGGGTATVYDLTIRKNGTSLGTVNLGEQAGNINIPVGWADLTPDAKHRFLTDTQISTWNAKQDAISDLATIRSNASHGNTAYGWGNHADAGYLTSFTETDPTVPGWAKASTKPSYTLDEVTDGSTRKLANYLPLTGGIISGTLEIVDSSDSKIILKSGDADNYNLIKFVANDDSVQGYLGTRGTADLKWNNYVIYHTNNLSLSTLGGVPTTRKVNNKALSADITLTLDDIGNGSTRSLANYLPLTGGTLTGGLTLSNVNQTFDVSAADRSIYYKASDAVSYRAVMFRSNGDLIIGYDGPAHSRTLYLDGFNEYLRFGATWQYSVKLNSTGTVELSGISAVLPVTANEVNLGSSARAFNNIYGKLDLSYVQSASDLKAIEALTGAGLAKRTADNTWELTDTADKAEELATFSEEDAMFTYRQVPSEAVGDVCKATAVKGKSVVWNQLLPIVSSYTHGGLSVTMDTNGHMVGGGTSTNGNISRFMNWYRDITAGHKYYFSFVGELSGIWLSPNCGTYGTPFSETVRSQILTATGTKMFIGKAAVVGNEMVIDGYLVCVDLTAAGLDDLTAAEFETLYPDYHAYNPGELVNNAASGIEMLDAGGTSLGTLSTPITEIVPADKPTVRLNQLAPVLDGTWGKNGVTYTFSDGVGTMTATGTGTGARSIWRNSVPGVSGHKYFFRYEMKADAAMEGGYGYAGRYAVNVWNLTTDWKTYCAIDTGRGTAAEVYVYGYFSDLSIKVYVRRIEVIDLTDMYGVGNEPTSIAEVEELIGSGYIPYNTGEDIPNRIFPDGMKSAGTAYDEWSGTTAVKRIGVVDLGTLTWTRITSSSYGGTWSWFHTTGIPMRYNNIIGSVITICDRYESIPSYSFSLQLNKMRTQDKTCMPYIDGVFYVRDDSYTDAAAFKAAVSGVYLYYELATPVTYTTDQPLPGTLAEFESGGTMRRLPVDTSEEVIAPMVCDFQYGANMSDVAKAYLPLSGGTVTGTLEAAGELIIPDSAPRNPDSTKVYLYCDTTGNYYQS